MPTVLMRRQPQRPSKHVVKKAGKKSRPTTKKKPAWDSTVNDLTVHQLSKDELELRRSRSLSKNAEKAKRELQEIATGARQLGSPGSQGRNIAGRSLPGKELHRVLEESDRAIAVVKDLFGDDPKRYSAQPNVTVAPRVITDRSALQRTLLESQGDGPTPSALYSPGGIRDDSVLGLVPAKPALNELPSPSSEFTIDEESGLEGSSLLSPDPPSPPPPSYRPAVVDLPRFQRLVEQVGEEEGEGEGTKRREGTHWSTVVTEAHPNTRGGVSVVSGGRLPHVPAGDEQLSSIAHTGSQQGEAVESTTESEIRVALQSSQHQQTAPQAHRQPHPLHIVHKMPHQVGAGMATSVPTSQQQTVGGDISRNQRHRKLPPGQGKSQVSSSSKGIHDDLSILQQLVGNLEQELQEYEQTSGYCFPVQRPPVTTQSGMFSSLTASLLASVTKLTHYLKQSEVQLKGEVAVRNQLLHAMAEQQNLMDALTADVVKLQEENASLKSGFQQLEQHTARQAKTLEESISELRSKISSLESSYSTVSVTPMRACFESSAPPPLAPVPSMTSSVVLTPASQAKDNMLYSSIDPVSLQPAPPQVDPFSTSTFNNAVPCTQGPLCYAPHCSSLLPPPTHPVMITSTPLTLPATSGPLPWSLPDTQQVPTHTSMPAHAFYHTPGMEAFCSPFSSVPVSQSATPLSVAGGLSLSPSELGVSPPPTSPTLQVPSLPFKPPLPPHTLSIQPAQQYTPLTHTQSLQQPIPLPQYTPSHINSGQSSFPATIQPPNLPLSLPCSWVAPPRPPPVTVMPDNTVCSTPTCMLSSTTAPASKTPSTVTVSTQQGETTTCTSVPLPNLALTNTSPTAPDTSMLPGVSPCNSNSSLDIEASLARMSSLARSVLQELAEDRGQLLKVSEHAHPSPALLSRQSNSSLMYTPHLPAVSSVVSSMTSVTTLDSSTSALLTSAESLTLEDSSPPSEEQDQPLSETTSP